MGLKGARRVRFRCTRETEVPWSGGSTGVQGLQSGTCTGSLPVVEPRNSLELVGSVVLSEELSSHNQNNELKLAKVFGPPLSR